MHKEFMHEENTKENYNRVVSLYVIKTRVFICEEEVNFLGLENINFQTFFTKISTLGPNRDLLRNTTFCLPAGNGTRELRESSAMLRQLSYEGRCPEHGHKFSIYEVGMPIE